MPVRAAVLAAKEGLFKSVFLFRWCCCMSCFCLLNLRWSPATNTFSLNDRLSIKGFPVLSNKGYEIYYCRKWRGKEFSGPLLIKLFPMIRWVDVVRLTSVYLFPALPMLLLCKLLRIPVIWSPCG
jgi:hypothetical protein